jgi:predicted nucleic acid-binding protein
MWPNYSFAYSRVWNRQRNGRLNERGAFRAFILLAATAYEEGLTLLHYDGDFDFIAEITGQPAEWVVPRSSV